MSDNQFVSYNLWGEKYTVAREHVVMDTGLKFIQYDDGRILLTTNMRTSYLLSEDKARELYVLLSKHFSAERKEDDGGE